MFSGTSFLGTGRKSHGAKISGAAKGSATQTGRRHRRHGRKWRASVAAPMPAEVAAYLGGFGFAAADAETWEDLPQDEVPEGLVRSGPWIAIGIAEHREERGHTWYKVECSLASPHGCAKTVQWQVSRRLQHLRELWHEPLKSVLGEQYKQDFEEAPFAHRCGYRGTSARLHAWCCRLSACINAGQMPPIVVALTLRFLEAPNFSICGPQPCGALASGDEGDSIIRCGSDHPSLAACSTSEGSGLSESEEEGGEQEYESDWECDTDSEDSGSDEAD